MTKAAKRIGRPMKAPARGKRVSLGLKVTADIKRRLDAAAQASGRTQSQEAEYRIELSYQYQRALGDFEQAKKQLAEQAKKLREEIELGLAEAALSRSGWSSVPDLRYGGDVWFPPGRLNLPKPEWVDPDKPSPPVPQPEIPPEPWVKNLVNDLDDAINRKIEHALDRAVDRIVERVKAVLNDRERGK
jgi:hypothetical protein